MIKLPTLRDRFEDSYTAVPIPAENKKGYKIEYIYYAPWYYWDMPEKKLIGRKAIICALSAVSLVLFVLAATSGKRELNLKPAVFLPSALALCAHIMEASALIQFAAAKYRTTKMTFNEVRRIMDFAPTARLILTLVTACVCLYCTLRGEGSAAVTALNFGAAALTLAELHLFNAIPMRTEENHALRDHDAALMKRREERNASNESK